MFVHGILLTVILFLQTVLGQTNFDPEKHENWRLLPKKNRCGLSAQQRIIGGTRSSLGAFPWIARIGYRFPEMGLLFDCGGTLISKNYVLTASHCTLQSQFIVLVRLGEHYTQTDIDCTPDGKECAPPVQDIPIVKVIQHEKFSQNSELWNDIALLRMARPPQPNKFVQPICLPYGGLMTKDFKNETTIVAGWGLTEKDVPSDYLLFVKQKVYDRNSCAIQYRSSGISLGPENSQLCVGGVKGKDSCNGDSGGPLMFVGPGSSTSARTYLLGIVSMGPTKCGSDTPGVYTRASYYMKWVLDHID